MNNILDKYNYEITKISKFLVFMLVTYFILLSHNDIFKMLLMIGILYIILDNYYPNIYYLNMT